MRQSSISLVMPALNAAEHITDALGSVAQQVDSAHVTEVVLADGGSNDRTRELASNFPFVRVLEGGDNGIYDGFNRGIEAARGEIVGFLNADDWLTEGALKTVRHAFGNDSGVDYVSGGVRFGDKAHQTDLGVTDRPLSAEGLLFGIPAINSRFFKPALLRHLGGFAPSAGLGADREFLMRLANSGATGQALGSTVYCYRVHAGSSTIAGDAHARNRIRNSDLQLGRYLREAGDLNEDDRLWVDRFTTLARFRGWVDRVRSECNRSKETARLCLVDWRHLPAALRAWLKWRGKLSGF